MYMAWFYPPGREKIHAVGALDLALWDIKGKALKLPVHQILGGAVRNYCECYPTGGGGTNAMSLRDRARATIEAGYRAFRIDAGAGTPIVDNVYNTHERVRIVAEACKEVREGVGKNGDWNVDLHQKFDYPDAVRCCKLIEEYEPYLVEDPTRDEQFLEDIPRLRQMTTVPLAAGEEWGQRWNFNRLVENHDIDYNRCTLPNVGGITEMLKIMAMCETHVVGIVPHFTGPISTAALVNCLSTFPGPVLFEFNYGDRPIDYLPECLDFKQGKVYPNERPGLGATLEMKLLKPIGEVTQPVRRQIYQRPDGSLTHW
jgi:L-alanine-DL-glutamate epimerase-like enolase superfamily enzyme